MSEVNSTEYGRGSAKDCRLHAQKLNTFIATQELRSEAAAERSALDSTQAFGAEDEPSPEGSNHRKEGFVVEGAAEIDKKEAEMAGEKRWGHFSSGFNYNSIEYPSGSQDDGAYGNEIETSSCAVQGLSPLNNMACRENIATSSSGCSMPLVFGAPPFAKRPRYFDYNSVSSIRENNLEFTKTKHTNMNKSNKKVVGATCESVGFKGYERNMTTETPTEIRAGELKMHREMIERAGTSAASSFIAARHLLQEPEKNVVHPLQACNVGSARIQKLFAKYADLGDWDDTNE